MTHAYGGPVIDAHHHLWDLARGHYPWITGAAALPLGDIAYLRHDYLIADYLADAAGTNLVGSVHVEASWDRSRDPVEETRWLDTLDDRGPVATRYVAYADLAAANAAEVLARQAAHDRVVGVRATIRWHPDPARRWSPPGVLDGAAFRDGVGHMARHGLLLELLMNPYQAADAARLAGDFPDLQLVVNHCGTPVDRDAAGIARWQAGLATMAAQPNIAIKVSNFGAYGPDRTLAALRETVMTCIDAFGPRRSLFGTDYPVARRTMTYAGMVAAFAAIVAEFSAAEQRLLFHDNAARIYRFEP